MTTNVDLKPSYLVASTAGALVIAGIYFFNKRKQNRIPTEWEPVGKVESIYLYPLKSGEALELKEAECTPFGLQQIGSETDFKLRDRSLVVYNEKNKEFITARTYPKMVLISVTEHLPLQDHLTFDAPGMRTLYVKIPKAEDDGVKKEKITMWHDEQIPTLDCGDEAASWFSRYILDKESGLRLGFHPADQRRDISKTHAEYLNHYKSLNNEATGMYSDLSSYMIINQSSIDELNSRLPAPISHKNFRPNIVIQGDKISPFAEDLWKWVRIGDVVFQNVKPCTRCIFTTIDPSTGIRSPEREPLKTLEKYRKLGVHLKWDTFDSKSIVMGVNLGLKRPGTVKLDDIVYLPKQ